MFGPRHYVPILRSKEGEMYALEHLRNEEDLRLLYVNVITALETYVSDKFISSVSADHELLRRFVETSPEFQSEKIPMSDVFKASEGIEQKVKTHLSQVVWHRLDKVKPMFRDTLSVEFPTDMKDLFKAIVLRHDLVHRNGKTMDGKQHYFEDDDIKKLIETAEQLVAHIESQRPTTDSDSEF